MDQNFTKIKGIRCSNHVLEPETPELNYQLLLSIQFITVDSFYTTTDTSETFQGVQPNIAIGSHV